MPRKRDKSVRLGLMGGTFNPVHYGHLTAAQEAADRFGLERVIFIPCGIPPHKDVKDLAPAIDRFLMTVLAIADNPSFDVSRYEIDKDEPSYTVATMAHFAAEYPDSELFFITGADSVLELGTWHEPERVFEFGNLIGVTRPGYTVDKAPDVAARVIWMEMPAIGVSATDIRTRVREGRPFDYLTPPAVVSYIENRYLYKG